MQDILYGVAVSAHQVEGSPNSDWNRWEKQNADKLAKEASKRLSSEKVWEDIRKEAENPENYISGYGVGHRDRYEQDFEIASDIGLDAFRNSFEWSRIQPEEGEFEDDEIEFYRDYLNSMKEYGLEPVMTLWHFTHPQWFEDEYGWHDDRAVEKFREYVEKVTQELGEEVEYWITLNEANAWVRPAYGATSIMPFVGLDRNWPSGSEGFSPVKGWKAYQNLKEAHREAYQIIHENVEYPKVGTATAVGAWRNPGGGLFAEKAKDMLSFIEYKDWINSTADHLDFIGVNHYAPIDVDLTEVAKEAGILSGETRYEENDLGWPVDVESLEDALRDVSNMDAVEDQEIPLFVTEHGAADKEDEIRPRLVSEAVDIVEGNKEDFDIIGYLHWSLLDNFEWDEGFWPRFGLVEVNSKTSDRKLRESAEVYSDKLNEVSEPDAE